LFTSSGYEVSLVRLHLLVERCLLFGHIFWLRGVSCSVISSGCKVYVVRPQILVARCLLFSHIFWLRGVCCLCNSYRSIAISFDMASASRTQLQRPIYEHNRFVTTTHERSCVFFRLYSSNTPSGEASVFTEHSQSWSTVWMSCEILTPEGDEGDDNDDSNKNIILLKEPNVCPHINNTLESWCTALNS
jgi:hypothetical protein